MYIVNKENDKMKAVVIRDVHRWFATSQPSQKTKKILTD